MADWENKKFHRREPFLVYRFFFLHTHLFSSFWTSRGHRCRPFPPPGSCLQFVSRIGFSNPTACRFFIECYSRSRAFRKSICAQEKVPSNLYEYALGGFELTKLTYIRLKDNLIHPPPRRPACRYTCGKCFFFFLILRRMGKNKAYAHHTSTYFQTRRVQGWC